MKIINNCNAYEIIQEALDTDLFIYLQPATTSLIYDNRDFESNYMESISKLGELNKNEPDARMGKKLYFLIKDFAATLTDWEKETKDKYSYTELYAKTWAECRNFVLPMNPVRKELEYAVKTALNELGVKSRTTTPKPAVQKNPAPQTQSKRSGNSKSGSSRHTGRL